MSNLHRNLVFRVGDPGPSGDNLVKATTRDPTKSPRIGGNHGESLPSFSMEVKAIFISVHVLIN